jgi:hypothetical protein
MGADAMADNEMHMILTELVQNHMVLKKALSFNQQALLKQNYLRQLTYSFFGSVAMIYLQNRLGFGGC